jgi:cellulose synthase/poly-beta-1,6-N-acetylglucosamine synthase-like glycosyltransferase
MNAPLVSVLMPVYNGAADLQKALDTILKQSFTDFEVIAINDGSRDDSGRLLDAVTDSRVRVIHQENKGLAATLNIGLSLARGSLIARQDQDDLSHPERLAKQVAYMQQHPECGLLGTAAEIWVGDTPTDRTHDHPTEHAELAFDLLFNNPFVHSSVMMRRDDVLAIGGYSTDRERQPPEDYELWSRMARNYRVANLPERLLVYREVPQSMSRTGPNPFLDRLVTICAENLAMANGMSQPNAAAVDAAAMTHSAFHRLSSRPDINAMVALVEKAGMTFAAECPRVADKTAERARILKYQWTLHSNNAQWARPFLRAVHAFGRRLRLFSS